MISSESVPIYVGNKNHIKYFIHHSILNATCLTGEITIISSGAFADTPISNMIIKAPVSRIEQKAFQNCRNLECLFYESIAESDSQSKSNRPAIINLNIPNCNIQTENSTPVSRIKILTEAFNNCSNLRTVCLPIINDLYIEKDAFSGCESLRTVVAITNKSTIIGNPFAECPSYLTFICKKNSPIARFAMEFGYRVIYVK